MTPGESKIVLTISVSSEQLVQVQKLLTLCFTIFLTNAIQLFSILSLKNSGSAHILMGNLRKTSTFPAGRSLSPGEMFMAKLFRLD